MDHTDVFVFGGTVIGGMDHRVTTLVSAHARRIAADQTLTRKHLQLQNLPVPSEDQPLPDGLDVRAYVAGPQVVAAVAYVPLAALEEQISPEETLNAEQLASLRSGPANPEGGIAVDVTELLDPALAELAADALWSVPGLAAGAVDLLVPQLDAAADAVVLGLDVEASVVTHHLPALGQSRDVAGAIVDQLLIRASR
ncbi:hypothetical protein GCM10009618_00880 [Nesterenkonia lacusekhoensis]